MICYVLAMGKQHLGQHVVVGYGIKIFGRAFSLRLQITWWVLMTRKTRWRSKVHFVVRILVKVFSRRHFSSVWERYV